MDQHRYTLEEESEDAVRPSPEIAFPPSWGQGDAFLVAEQARAGSEGSCPISRAGGTRWTNSGAAGGGMLNHAFNLQCGLSAGAPVEGWRCASMRAATLTFSSCALG